MYSSILLMCKISFVLRLFDFHKYYTIIFQLIDAFIKAVEEPQVHVHTLELRVLMPVTKDRI